MTKIIHTLIVCCMACSGCCLRARPSAVDYQRILMTDGAPSAVVGYPYDRGFVQFQLFNKNLAHETLVVYRIDKGNITADNTVSLEDYDYFDRMEIVTLDGHVFFVVTLRNTGNAHGNKVKAWYIDKHSGACYPAAFVRADSVYATRLPGNQWIWDDEVVSYHDSTGIYSHFFVWQQGDTHPQPSVGRVDVTYGIQVQGKNRYSIVPQQMRFTKSEE